MRSASGEQEGHVVLDDQNCDAGVGGLAEAAGEVGLFGLGQAGGGFVQQHRQGLAGEGAGEFDRAAGAGGQSAAAGMDEVGNAGLVDEVHGVGPRGAKVAVDGDAGGCHGFQHGGVGREVGGLEAAGDAGMGAAVRRLAGDVGAGHVQRCRCRWIPAR